MKIKRTDSSTLRRVLIGMITDPIVIARLADKWEDGGMFASRWANLVAHWAIRFYRKHNKPIGLAIESNYERWAENHADKELTKLVGNFLAVLDSEYDPNVPVNSEHILDLAKEQIQIARIKDLNEKTEGLLGQGKVDEASQSMLQYREVNLGLGSFVEPTKDFSLWVQAFEKNNQESIFSYPGDLGKLLGNVMHRDGFVSWMGVEKAGKSYTLIDATFRALRRGAKVAYFEAGDLGQDEVHVRLGERITGLPRRVGSYLIPNVPEKGSSLPQDDIYWLIRYEDTVGPRSAFAAIQKLCKNKHNLRVSTHPNSSLTTAEIDSVLTGYDAEEWTPDVVVVDYADILAPPTGMRDPLEQIDENWRHLRRISQKWHCLMLTATQASANTYDQKQPMSRKNFSGRKTKLAHVSAMIGLNIYNSSRRANGREEPLPIHWNLVVRRNGYCNPNQEVTVHGCMGIGRPVMVTHRRKFRKSQE